MKISTLIAQLSQIEELHGDCDVSFVDGWNPHWLSGDIAELRVYWSESLLLAELIAIY